MVLGVTILCLNFILGVRVFSRSDSALYFSLLLIGCFQCENTHVMLSALFPLQAEHQLIPELQDD